MDGGVGPVQSGVPVATPAIVAPATFTLTVVNGAGRSVTRALSLTLGIDVFPGDSASIQAAIDLATPGTTVLLHPGTYRPAANGEAMLVFRAAKNGVSLRGTGATPDEVILDGSHQVLHVAFFDAGIDASTTVENLTVTGGRAVPGEVLPPGYVTVLRPEILSMDNDFYNDGAGLMLFTASPTVSRVRIHDNYAFRCGGGISVFAPGGQGFPAVGPVIRDSEFRGNAAGSGTGGAIDVYNGVNADIVNDLFVGNFGWGGSIAVLDGASALIRHCTFDGGANIGAVAATPNAAATIRDSIFVNMTLQPPYDLMAGPRNQASNCCFWNVAGWTPEAGRGHVVADPLFAAGPRGAYYLGQVAAGQPADSPCVDAGSVAASALPGLTTRTDGLPDVGLVDVGYHYQP